MRVCVRVCVCVCVCVSQSTQRTGEFGFQLRGMKEVSRFEGGRGIRVTGEGGEIVPDD